MFGYVTLYRKGLADAEMDRYQAYYCGLCRTLGRRYGRTGQLALSYDMAFVAILLTALYDTPTAFSEGRCVPHPLKKRPRADNELLDYAADMTAALAYYNFLDDWQDDHRRASLAQAQKLEPSLPALRERWPRQLQTMAAQLTQQMGRCAQQFEMLPILKDTPEGKLLYNTIYSGVWSKYALVRKHREAKRHD